MGFNKFEPYNGSASIMGEFAEEVGTGFRVFTAAGFVFHLSKGLFSAHLFASAFRLACFNAPRVGGVGGAYFVVAYSVNAGIEYFRSRNDTFNVFASSAADGAAMRARDDIKSASCTALGVASVATLLDTWVDEREKRSVVEYKHTGPPYCAADKEAKDGLAFDKF